MLITNGDDITVRLTRWCEQFEDRTATQELMDQAAREIERLRLTDAEREAISEVVDCLTETGTALANPTTTRNTLAALLERLK